MPYTADNVCTGCAKKFAHRDARKFCSSMCWRRFHHDHPDVVAAWALADLAGQRFGKLTAMRKVAGTRKAGRPTVRAKWLCLCECGQEKEIIAESLLRGQSRSCGCFRGEWQRKDGTPIRSLLCQCKHAATKRGLSFHLTLEDYSTLVTANCHYCDAVPSQVYKANGNKFLYNGVDRVDNACGYSTSNCVPCCGLCNWMKRDATQEAFIEHCMRIYKHLRE